MGIEVAHDNPFVNMFCDRFKKAPKDFVSEFNRGEFKRARRVMIGKERKREKFFSLKFLQLRRRASF